MPTTVNKRYILSTQYRGGALLQRDYANKDQALAAYKTVAERGYIDWTELHEVTEVVQESQFRIARFEKEPEPWCDDCGENHPVGQDGVPVPEVPERFMT